ncbi:MAG: type II toxin-antitoxin system RelE/ParE family toxin [Elusimicrobia bacterium]|nr:type II toxin-antitoxin system RelE/ParE family toxin [Elusimicrobiota bacterium]
MKEIVFFTINGKIPFIEWRDSLDAATKQRVFNALFRLKNGNFGDWKIISPGLCEMRLFFAGGLRIYYTERKGKIIILLCGGDKKTQSKDIAKAKRYLTQLGGTYD